MHCDSHLGDTLKCIREGIIIALRIFAIVKRNDTSVKSCYNLI